MDFSIEHISQLAPDASALSAGQKTSAERNWSHLGKTDYALWGECQGSALYQCRIDLVNFAYKCSCPSRKLPCKHTLGLLFLQAQSPHAIPSKNEPPEWVTDWLSRRTAASQKKADKESSATVVDVKAQERRQEKRENRVTQGIEQLKAWLADTGLFGLSHAREQAPDIFLKQAQRMVDHQMPQVASRIRALGNITLQEYTGHETLLIQLGRLALLCEAYQRIETISTPLAYDIRYQIGWTLDRQDLIQLGEKCSDLFTVIAQKTEEDGQLRTQRTWLYGSRTKKIALIIQFSPNPSTPFSDLFIPGFSQETEIVFYPSAYSQRAALLSKSDTPTPLAMNIPGLSTTENFLHSYAAALSQQPWLDRMCCIMNDCTLSKTIAGGFAIRDAKGDALPLGNGNYWKLIACAGSKPFTLIGEWNGLVLDPLSIITVDGFRETA